MYGVDLAHLFSEKRWRQLLALIDGLPTHSRYMAAILSDPEIAEQIVNSPDYVKANQDTSPSLIGYSATNYQLADVIDGLKALQATQVATQGGKATPPKPTPRPKTAIEKAKDERRKRDQKSLISAFTTTE